MSKLITLYAYNKCSYLVIGSKMEVTLQANNLETYTTP